MNRTRLFIACLLAAATSAAHAEKADREIPINIDADRVSMDDISKVQIFEGHVVFIQGTMQLRTNKLVVTRMPMVSRRGSRRAVRAGWPISAKSVMARKNTSKGKPSASNMTPARTRLNFSPAPG